MDLDSLSSWMQTCWGCTPFSSLSGSGILARALARGDRPFTLGAGVSRVGAVISLVSRRCSDTLSHLHSHTTELGLIVLHGKGISIRLCFRQQDKLLPTHKTVSQRKQHGTHCFNFLVATLISMSGPDRHLRLYCWYIYKVAVCMTNDRKVVLQCRMLNRALDWVQNGTMTLLTEPTSCPNPDAMLAMVFSHCLYMRGGEHA